MAFYTPRNVSPADQILFDANGDPVGIQPAGSSQPPLMGLTPDERTAVQSMVSAYGIQGTPAAVAATVQAPSRIVSYLKNGAIVGHRGLGGYATGTAGTLPTPDPMAGSVGTDPEQALSSVLKGFALGVRCFELDVWGDGGYMSHDQDPRRVVRDPAFTASEVVTRGSYRTNASNTYRAIADGTCGATAPTGTALTPVSDGAVGWQWVGASLPTDVTTLTRSAFKDLQISATYFMGPGYENQPTMTLRDLFTELGGRCLFILEAKNAAGGRAIANALREFNIPTDTVLVASFTSAWTLQARLAGYQTLQYAATADTLTTAQVIAAGAIGYATLDQDTWTTAKVNEFHAAGLVTGCVLNSPIKYNRDLMRAAGLDFITTAEPLYLSDLGGINDGVWTDGRWPAGQIGESLLLSEGGRGVIKTASAASAYGWGYSTSNGTRATSTLMGQFCQLPATFKRRFWLQLASASATNQGAYLAICCPDDRPFVDVAGRYADGYLVRLRRSGVMDLYRITRGMTIGAPDATATATGVGTDLLTNRCQFELEVSATQIKITNITGGNVTATLTNADFRGQFMHIGRTNATYTIDTWQAV